MTKYLFILLLATFIYPTSGRTEATTTDFEAELRLLESHDLVQEEKAEVLVEKMSAQNNLTRENDLVEDSVSTKKSAILKNTPDPELEPLNALGPITAKKTRRIPSR
ncbi:MAG: hypothetical protein H7281_01865 [Bacteriovorax sp.]|nr:hypothetical protein [Bacteriovorax sp.]